MGKLNLPHIVKLFNAGVLRIKSAYWLCEKGYVIVWGDGKVQDIVLAK